MATKPKLPNHYSGNIYFVEELELNLKTNLSKELIRAKEENGVSWKIKDCILTFDEKSKMEKLKFDIDDQVYAESYFTGFLYDDGKIRGKIIFTDTKYEPEIITGIYSKYKKNRIIAAGIWDDNNVKYNFIIELIC